jgi:HKD family nuclease
MDIRFIGQPVTRQIGSELVALLEDENTTSAKFLVAWGKNSGLRRIREPLEDARSRGVDIEIVVGVDEGGATIQGLEALLDLSDRAFVFHNPGRPKRTFHPKVYIFDGANAKASIVGSGNLTSGGLFGNYEAASIVRVATDDPDENAHKYIADIDTFYTAIRDDPASTRLLDADLVQALKDHPTIIIGDERYRGQRGPAGDSSALPSSSLFEKSEVSLLGIPTVASSSPKSGRPTEVDDEEDDDDGIALIDHLAEIDATEAGADAGEIEIASSRGFYKRLSSSDVSLSSSPGQIIIPIRFREFFGDLERQDDRLRIAGSSQQGRDGIPTVFIDGTSRRNVSSRVILYEPAPDHPRPNPELRFTFRDRDVLESLGAGDYLDFAWHNGELHVVRATAQRSTAFDWD